MNAMILPPFAIGTLAFFSTLLTGIMWGGWGCAALMTFLDENGFLAALRS